MSNPDLSPLLRAAAAARRLSAIALWFAALCARILPGAARRREEEAAVWRYIEDTMARFADLLERHAAGEIEPPRATMPRRRRSDSARNPGTTRIVPRAPRAPRIAIRQVKPRRIRACPRPAGGQPPFSACALPPKPIPSKTIPRHPRETCAPFVSIY